MRIPRPGETWRSRTSLASWTITVLSDEPCANGSPDCVAAPPHRAVVDSYLGPVCPHVVAALADHDPDSLSDDAVLSLSWPEPR
jgi:hypothetical protein